MNIIILGAGEFGRNLAETFCNDQHNVAVIEIDDQLVQRIRNKLDILTVNGDGTDYSNLRDAGIDDADLFIAAGNTDASNILACQMAKHNGRPKTICRLSSLQYFAEVEGFTPQKLGIDHIIVPKDECAEKIVSVMDYQHVLEKVTFSTPDALLTAVNIVPTSPLAGMKLSDFPETDLLSKIRFSGIIRNHKLIVPHGDTVIEAGDEVYIAGKRDNVELMVEAVNPSVKRIKRIVIAGGNALGRILADRLTDLKYDVRLIEDDLEKCKALSAELEKDLLVLNGSPTDKDILEEAGIESCDAFISVLEDDEDSMLSCILAKQHRAAKVLAVTNKAEYSYIVPTIDSIDCGFSIQLVASNSVLRLPLIGQLRIDAILQRTNAYVFEFEVTSQAPVCNQTIRDCKCPPSIVFSLVIRNNEVLSASGDITLMEGDRVVVISIPETVKLLEPLFLSKHK